jgi:hypothetical protein
MSLIDKLNVIFKNDEYLKELSRASEKEKEEILIMLEDVKNNLSFKTMTWATKLWENELAIKNNESMSYEERVSVIKSKLRGIGKVDEELIKSIADAWTNGAVDVSFNNGIEVQFTAFIGRPPNKADVENAISEVKPAHLSLLLKNRYLTVGEVNAMTIAQLEEQKLHHFEPFI